MRPKGRNEVAPVEVSDALLDLDCVRSNTQPTEELQECVVLIEDSRDAMLLVLHALQEYGNGKYRLEWARDLTSGIDKISRGGVDIVLLDLGLPDSSGAAGYSWVHQVAPDIPVLVLTGDLRQETEFAVISRGADDYLTKDNMSGGRLVEAIAAAVDLSQQRSLNEMRTLALHTKIMLCGRAWWKENLPLSKSSAARDANASIEQKGIRFFPDDF